jgi:hypothetical protein
MIEVVSHAHETANQPRLALRKEVLTGRGRRDVQICVAL